MERRREVVSGWRLGKIEEKYLFSLSRSLHLR